MRELNAASSSFIPALKPQLPTTRSHEIISQSWRFRFRACSGLVVSLQAHKPTRACSGTTTAIATRGSLVTRLVVQQVYAGFDVPNRRFPLAPALRAALPSSDQPSFANRDPLATVVRIYRTEGGRTTPPLGFVFVPYCSVS